MTLVLVMTEFDAKSKITKLEDTLFLLQLQKVLLIKEVHFTVSMEDGNLKRYVATQTAHFLTVIVKPGKQDISKWTENKDIYTKLLQDKTPSQIITKRRKHYT